MQTTTTLIDPGLCHHREWMEGNQLWVQQVSSAPFTRADIIQLEELLDRRLQQSQARGTGICPQRTALSFQCFGGQDHCGEATTGQQFTDLHAGGAFRDKGGA